jgi:hypothetical protein
LNQISYRVFVPAIVSVARMTANSNDHDIREMGVYCLCAATATMVSINRSPRAAASR